MVNIIPRGASNATPFCRRRLSTNVNMVAVEASSQGRAGSGAVGVPEATSGSVTSQRVPLVCDAIALRGWPDNHQPRKLSDRVV